MNDTRANNNIGLRSSTWLNLEPGWPFGVAVIAMLSLIGYWPSLGGGFVWDDMVLVAKNPLVTGTSNLGNIWFTGDFSLSTVVTWIEWLAFEKNPAGYRVVNLLLHIGSALMIWRILARLKFSGAWLAGLLFAVHPVCVASVAWISELKNTLSLPLFLASIWFFLNTEAASVPTKQPSKTSAAYITSIICFALALMAKTSTVMLPVLLLMLAWWKRGRISKGDLLKTAPHFALALTFGFLSVWYQTHQAIRAVIPQQENLIERLLAAAMAVWFYTGKAIFPANLSMIYSRWEISGFTMLTLLPLLSLVAIAIGLGLARRKWPWARATQVALGSREFVHARSIRHHAVSRVGILRHVFHGLLACLGSLRVSAHRHAFTAPGIRCVSIAKLTPSACCRGAHRLPASVPDVPAGKSFPL